MTKQPALPALAVPDQDIIDESHAESRRLFEQMLGDLAWADTYLALMDEGWGWRKAAYIAWASLPVNYRAPETMADFANIIGLAGTKSIRNWRLANKAIDLAVARLSIGSLIDKAPDVIAALTESASSPNYKSAPDRKLFFEMAGLYTPRQSIGLHTDEAAGDLSQAGDDDLARLAGMGEEVSSINEEALSINEEVEDAG